MKIFAAFSSALHLHDAVRRIASKDGASARYEVLRLENLTIDPSRPALVSTSGHTSWSKDQERTLVDYPGQIIKALLGRGLPLTETHPLLEAFGKKEQILVLYPSSSLLDWATLLREAGANHVIETRPKESYE